MSPSPTTHIREPLDLKRDETHDSTSSQMPAKPSATPLSLTRARWWSIATSTVSYRDVGLAPCPAVVLAPGAPMEVTVPAASR